DEPVHGEAERAEHALYLAVLAFLQGDSEPHIRALNLVELRFDGPVADAFDLDAVPEPVEFFLRDLAPGAHAVAPRPARRGQFEQAGKLAVIGEEEKPLRVDVEAADGDDAGHMLRQALEDGRAAFRVLRRGDE